MFRWYQSQWGNLQTTRGCTFGSWSWKILAEKDAMWHSCMSNSISSKHKLLTNVRTVQWILHWPVHSTQTYHKFPCQILSPFCDDAGLPAQQISSYRWYLTYHVSALTALLENVIGILNSVETAYLTVYEAIPNNCKMHFFLI